MHDYRTKAPKPESEHAIMAVPAIVSEAEFEAVQRSLKARSPKMMPPMAVGGPTLLTGICFCACCGGAMTLRTGTSSVGREYRYYTCSTKARQGAKGCPGITVPMDRLNEAVIGHLEWRLLDPKRLEDLMDQILERRDEWVDQRRLRNGDGSFARDHVRAVAQRVEVVSKTEVRIGGLRSELLRTLTAASGVEAAVLGVRGFEPKWRATLDRHDEHNLPFLLR